MRNIIILFGLFFFSLTTSAQIEKYEDALEIIIYSNEYKEYTNNSKKYHVSDELIVFSKMGKMFKDKLVYNGIELSDYDIIVNDKKSNIIDNNLLKLNKKKCAKLKIYFTEENNGIFFAELIRESKHNVKYDNKTHFGISHMYMFKESKGKVELLYIQEINYN